jgi:hypothetical protein
MRHLIWWPMTQSKQEVAARNAKIRAEKLRENLARRKQQVRQKAAEHGACSETENALDVDTKPATAKPIGGGDS